MRTTDFASYPSLACVETEEGLRALVARPSGYRRHHDSPFRRTLGTILVDVDRRWNDGRLADLLGTARIELTADPDATAFWAGAIAGLAERSAPIAVEALGSLEGELDGLFVRAFERRALGRARLVASVLADLHERRAEPVSLATVAANAGYAPNHLNDVVRAATGRSIARWHSTIRLTSASHALRRGASVNATATQFGYSDLGYFSRAFRRTFGVTPSRWAAAR